MFENICAGISFLGAVVSLYFAWQTVKIRRRT